jgi:hypothetical protein
MQIINLFPSGSLKKPKSPFSCQPLQQIFIDICLTPMVTTFKMFWMVPSSYFFLIVTKPSGVILGKRIRNEK